jgi:hypothetical protein
VHPQVCRTALRRKHRQYQGILVKGFVNNTATHVSEAIDKLKRSEMLFNTILEDGELVAAEDKLGPLTSREK